MSNTVSLPPTTVAADTWASTLGKPMFVVHNLLRPEGGCPSCSGPLRNVGFSDWVERHGLVVTLWTCISAPSQCEASRLDTTFRLETEVVAPPAREPAQGVALPECGCGLCGECQDAEQALVEALQAEFCGCEASRHFDGGPGHPYGQANGPTRPTPVPLLTGEPFCQECQDTCEPAILGAHS